MIHAGQLDTPISFYRPDATGSFSDASDGYEETAFWSGMCKFRPQNSRERMDAGRMQASVQATIWLRRDSVTETITAADKAIISGTAYQVRSDPIMDGARDRFVSFTVERGVAV